VEYKLISNNYSTSNSGILLKVCSTSL